MLRAWRNTSAGLLLFLATIALSLMLGATARAGGNSPLDALEGAGPDRKVSVLEDLQGQKGEVVLVAAAAHTRSSDADVREAAMRVLGQHPDIEAAMYLLNAAQRADEAAERRLALRQAVLSARNADARAREKVDLYRSVLFAADRKKEKKRALSGLGEVHTTDALALVAEQMEDEEVAQAAARSAVSIATGGDGVFGPGVAQTMRRVTRVSRDAGLRKEAAKHLKTAAEKLRKEVTSYKQPELDLLSSGNSLERWMGSPDSFKAEDGVITCVGGHRDLLTKKEYSDFIFRFEFKLTPGANNGVGVRLPDPEDYEQAPAYAGSELQILHNDADKYSDLSSYQYHGSLYGVAAAERGALNPPGKWNTQEVIAIGPWITVKVNGETILQVNMDSVEPADGKEHPGLKRVKGHLGFLGHDSRVAFRNVRVMDLSGPLPPASPDRKALNEPPEGCSSLFNGEDLTGWKGLVADPLKRRQMDPVELARKQLKANRRMRKHWTVENGILTFDGKGDNLCTVRSYPNFELGLDWRIRPKGDSGIYLRGTPQVQIWDPYQSPTDHRLGSGALFNNKEHSSKPIVCADRPIGYWNTFLIQMVGKRVTVDLNGRRVVDNVVLENFWDRSRPIFGRGQIELQSHHSKLYFRDIHLRELAEKSDDTQD